MTSPEDQLGEHVRLILRRFCRQNGLAAPLDHETEQISRRLWEIILTKGLPPPLAPGEIGSPGELSAAEVMPMVEAVLEGNDRRAALIDPVRQLVKTCFHREFAVCRDSYREVSADGSCRRQTLKKALGRVSGAHCVDCPYWTALSPAEHAEKLSAAWRGETREFSAHRDVYLPEDFRALRMWLHAATRSGITPRQR
ncbi:MAG TPA: hypothetical protein VL069_05915 [Opitutus sp.]|nr:hypothetical protein [Opitutus sp.]